MRFSIVVCACWKHFCARLAFALRHVPSSFLQPDFAFGSLFSSCCRDLFLEILDGRSLVPCTRRCSAPRLSICCDGEPFRIRYLRGNQHNHMPDQLAGVPSQADWHGVPLRSHGCSSPSFSDLSETEGCTEGCPRGSGLCWAASHKRVHDLGSPSPTLVL